MSEPFLGEITMFAGNFNPRGWAYCNGQLLPISQNTALFSLLGTSYGGDGESTFALPELRGRAVMHHGDGPGLTPRSIGEKIGTEETSLTVDQLPAHRHQIPVTPAGAETDDPEGQVLATQEEDAYTDSPGGQNYGSPTTTTGSNTPMSNMQPFLTINYIIATIGVYPSRSLK